MPMPKSVIKVKKDGIQYISNVDRIQYTIEELTRGALRDIGKFLRILMMRKGRKLRGLRSFKIKRIPNAFQYWVRKRETNLWIGIKANTWYGVDQELGTNRQPKRGIVKNTTMENLRTIKEIEAKYLSAIDDELKAKALIDENNEGENDAE